jgi:hypothetical protein
MVLLVDGGKPEPRVMGFICLTNGNRKFVLGMS